MRETIERTVIWFFLIAFALFMLYPFWVALWGGLKSLPQIYETRVFVPAIDPDFSAVSEAFEKIRGPFVHSVSIAVMTALIAIFGGMLGGYVLVRGQFRGIGVIFALVLFAIYIPPVTKLLPTLKIIQWLGLYDTNFAVGLAAGGAMMPMSTILYRQFFLRFPKSYWEVNSLAGGNHIDGFFRIALPLAKVPTVTVAVLALGVGWNVYMLPLVLTGGSYLDRPIGVALGELRTAAGEDGSLNVMLAGAVMAAIPVVILYLFAQKYVVRGFRNTGT